MYKGFWGKNITNEISKKSLFALLVLSNLCSTHCVHLWSLCVLRNVMYHTNSASNEYSIPISWWRHQMQMFSVLLALCVGNSPVTGEFSTQRPVTWSFDVFFGQCLNKWMSKQSHWWMLSWVYLWSYITINDAVVKTKASIYNPGHAIDLQKIYIRYVLLNK